MSKIKELKLGELLRTLNIVGASELAETIKLAVQVGLPLGRALVLSGHLTEEELDIALEIQTLIKKNDLPVPIAGRAFNLVRSDGVSLHEALKKSGWTQSSEAAPAPSRLGSLLCDAKLITRDQLEEAQKTSYETGLPLGRMLVLMGMLSHPILAKALEMQRMIREGTLSHNQAVLNLHSSGALEIEESLAQQGLEKGTGRKAIRLGELLMLSGLLTEGDIMNALEHGLTHNKPLGDVLMELGLVNKSILELALELQTSVCDGSLNIHAATDTLHYVASTGDTSSSHAAAQKAAEERQSQADKGKVVRLGELLQMSGFVDQEDIQQAIDLSTKYPSLIGKMLVVSGAIDEATLLSALRCQFLLRNGHINIDNSIRALQYAKQNHLSLDDALEELGIKVPPTVRRDMTSLA
jgi:hypothetical protein